VVCVSQELISLSILRSSSPPPPSGDVEGPAPPRDKLSKPPKSRLASDCVSGVIVEHSLIFRIDGKVEAVTGPVKSPKSSSSTDNSGRAEQVSVCSTIGGSDFQRSAAGVFSGNGSKDALQSCPLRSEEVGSNWKSGSAEERGVVVVEGWSLLDSWANESSAERKSPKSSVVGIDAGAAAGKVEVLSRERPPKSRSRRALYLSSSP